MERYRSKWFTICLVGACAFFLSRLKSEDTADADATHRLSNTLIEEKLYNQSHEFNVAKIIEVTEGVFVAIGYAIANSIIVECNQSLTVVDTTESIRSASQIRNDLLTSYPRLKDKAVKHIVYTHYHPDHTFGTKGWVDDDENPPVVIAHPQTAKELERILSVTSTITHIRAKRQFGNILKELQDGFNTTKGKRKFSHHEHSHTCADLHHDHDENHDQQDEDEQLRMEQRFQNDSGIFVHSGIGPCLMYGDPHDRSMFYPTLILNRSIEILDLDGVTFEFHHAPGETVDQIFVYLPEKRVLMPADNIYRAFPNIYAIRGSPTRCARSWVRSLDAMRRLSPFPQYLVPHHTRPVYGEEAIYDVLTSYRDGISFVHDQTIRYINLGYVPDDIVVLVRHSMPHRLSSHPFLQEFYGTIDWSVRAIFQAYLGWFSGDPVDLYPLSKRQKAARLLKMVGSPDVLLQTAEQSLLHHTKRDDCQWALQLSDLLLSLSNEKYLPTDEENDNVTKITKEETAKATEIGINALQCLASYMTSANGRNYYLTSAYELMNRDKSLTIFGNDRDREWVSKVVPLEQLFQMLPVRFKADDMQNFNMSLCFHFTDLKAFYLIIIRDGIVELSNDEYDDSNSDILQERCVDFANGVSELTSEAFRSLIAADSITGALMYSTGQVKIIKGSVFDFANFRGYFQAQ